MSDGSTPGAYKAERQALEERQRFSPLAPPDLNPGRLVAEAFDAGWRAAAHAHSGELEHEVRAARLDRVEDLEQLEREAHSAGYRRAEEWLERELGELLLKPKADRDKALGELRGTLSERLGRGQGR
jgi:hypothetical protein